MEMLRDLHKLLASDGDLGMRDEQGVGLVRKTSIQICFLHFIYKPLTLFFSVQLHIAAANGYVSVGELLLENKVSPDDKDVDGWTPLHAAACWGQVSTAKLRSDSLPKNKNYPMIYTPSSHLRYVCPSSFRPTLFQLFSRMS